MRDYKGNEVAVPSELAACAEHLEVFQHGQLATLRCFAKVCEQLGLRYYLASGTALGAARHSGFIPWDDDIDVIMPRPDFDKLEDLIFAGKTKLRAYSWTRTKNYFVVPMKVGPSHVSNLDHSPFAIDVFPMDILPKSRILRKVQEWIRLVLIQTMLVRYRTPIVNFSGFRKCLLRMIGFFLPNDTRKVHAIIRNMVVQKSDFTADAIVGGRFSQYGEREFMPFGIYGVNGGGMVNFEGEQFRAPVELEKYLANFFGNWKSLPPVENRIPKHDGDGPWFYDEMI